MVLSAAPPKVQNPDLTKGEKPFEETSFNVGPTGFRGWVFHKGTDSSESRQILVKSVDTNSPADGVFLVGDVILGADGTGAAGATPAFRSDARRTIADAITDAEARNPATLKLLHWRNGRTSTVTLTLETMGAYADTAPYKCQKSRKILDKCAKAFYEADEPGAWNLGILVLLAAADPGNPMNDRYLAKAGKWARTMIAPTAELNPNTSKVAWSHSYQLIILSEYYLKTRDAQVLPTLKARADCYARNQSWFGTTGHQYATKQLDGSDNGPMAGYGAINGTGVAGLLGMVLAREAGVDSPELNAAIRRSDIFFSSFATKSGIPYGEHSYGDGGGMYDMNGKNATLALALMLQKHRAKEARFFAMMAAASSSDRQDSHAGPYFNYVWPPLGAAAIGEEAAAHYFKRTRWLYELARCWDGKMVDDHFGHSEKYRNFPGALTTLLTYALPLRQLYITGRGHDRSAWLTPDEMKAVVAAEDYDVKGSGTDQKVAGLSSWSPIVRNMAAKALADTIKKEAQGPALLPRLHASAGNRQTSATTRNAACQVLGFVGDPSSAPVLSELLSDEDSYVRYGAAAALRSLPREAVMPQLNKILAATATTIRPVFPLVEGDPLQFAHHQLAMMLFYDGNAYGPKGLLAKDIRGIDRKQLWPAVRAVARTPAGQGRSTVASIYKQLTRDDVIELADSIVESVRVVAPADAMFAGGVRSQGASVLQKYSFAEGVPLCRAYADRLPTLYPTILKGYGGPAITVDPDPDIMQFVYDQWAVRGLDLSGLVGAMLNDTNTVPLTPLKRIDSVAADSPVVTLPAKTTALRVRATNYVRKDEKDTLYTWRKVHGAGAVRFSPNGTWDSKNTAVEFTGEKPGKYRFEVTMSDVLGYTLVRDTVDVTLLGKKGLFGKEGQLPPNNPPVAESQSIEASPGIPIALKLRGSDPEGDDIAFMVTGKPSHGTLSGTAPDLRYTAHFGYAGSDRIAFSVVDGQGVSMNGEVRIKVSSRKVGVTVYEGFDCKPGYLDGQAGASSVGLSSVWAAGKNTYKATAGSFSYAALPAADGKTEVPSWGKKPRASRPLAAGVLARDGLVSAGKEMWFSVVIGVKKECNRTNGSILFGLMDSSKDGVSEVGFAFKQGNLLARLNSEEGPGRSTNSSGGGITFPPDKPHLVVGHCQWGATDDTPDTVTIYRVLDITRRGPVLLEKPISVMSKTVNQSTLNTLYFEYNDRFYLDEIRIGPTYESVLLGTVPLAEGLVVPALPR
jgi:hypothetical protein